MPPSSKLRARAEGNQSVGVTPSNYHSKGPFAVFVFIKLKRKCCFEENYIQLYLKPKLQEV